MSQLKKKKVLPPMQVHVRKYYTDGQTVVTGICPSEAHNMVLSEDADCRQKWATRPAYRVQGRAAPPACVIRGRARQEGTHTRARLKQGVGGEERVSLPGWTDKGVRTWAG